MQTTVEEARMQDLMDPPPGFEDVEETPPPPEDVLLLREIRDALKST